MIYLDNAATTRMNPEAAELYAHLATEQYANSESLHTFGFSVQQLLDHARDALAKKAGVKPEEFFFAPCGTLADNTAILGTVDPKRGGRIVTSAFEHPAVAECMKKLESSFDVVYLRPENGIITPEQLSRALTPDTRLVSIMHVNNETGAVADLRALSAVIRRSGCGALFHTDAIQGFLKEPLSYSCVDLASFSAHKTHGPKGLGALYVRRGVRIRPVYYGGGHEKGLFSGTVNVPGIAAWAKAVENTDCLRERTYVEVLNTLCRSLLLPLGARIVSPEHASPYILSVIFPNYIAENIIHALSRSGIAVSSGSACSSRHPGAVFRALGLESYAKNALRISFCAQNTEAEIRRFAEVLSGTLGSLIQK